jgi:hypothetical protein
MNSYREHVQAMKCLARNTGSLVYTLLTHAGFFFAMNIIIIIICCYNVFFVNTLLIGSNVY